MRDEREGLEDIAEEMKLGEYSVLVRFVTSGSISEQAAVGFLEKIKSHYGFPYEPLYMLGDQGKFNWNDKDKTKRGMARTYAIHGFPTEQEADRFAADLETKKGVEWAYRDIPIEIDDPDMMNLDDEIEGLKGRL